MEENSQISLNNILGKTFFWMFLGVLGSGIIAWYTYSSGLFYDILINNSFNILLIVELVVVLVFSFLFKKLSPTIVGILYFAYAMLNGITLSVIFAAFELNSVVYVFGISAIIFAILSFIGFKTNRDLSKMGTYLSLFLIGGLVLTLINLFLNNSGLALALDWFILLVFMGLTIYDINKVKLLASDTSIDNSKVHIYAAMQLYLDFINIFLRILSIFGKRRS